MPTLAQMVSADPIFQQIAACNAAIATISAAIASNGQFAYVQLNQASPINLLGCGLTAADTNTMLTGFENFLTSKITTLTASLTAI